ncbi:hypothetical protein NMY22_g14623 [Coprinellus aureogranulatus]|nr:hypothetical protein NMY22_g14623 [Coprinellus aureogranulatus]
MVPTHTGSTDFAPSPLSSSTTTLLYVCHEQSCVPSSPSKITSTVIPTHFRSATRAFKGSKVDNVTQLLDLTLRNEGVVNRASGLRAWETKEQDKEAEALKKYRNRGYVLHNDCVELHGENDTECEVCSRWFKRWNQGVTMMFEQGGMFKQTSRIFGWRLGQQPREKDKMFWKDRGVSIVVQGDGDGRAYVYDGLAKKTLMLYAERVAHLFW